MKTLYTDFALRVAYMNNTEVIYFTRILFQ